MLRYPEYVVVLLVLLFCSRALPQDFPQGNDQNKTYTLAGTVVNSVTGRPVPRALVRLMRSGSVMLTDPQGEFSFDNVPPGTTELLVTKPGYFRPGPKPPNYPALAANNQPYKVDVGPDVVKAVLKLAPEAVLSGSVTGKDEEPVEGVMVDVLASEIIEGRRQLIPAHRNVASDEDGNFRIAGLAPGRYYVAVKAGRAGSAVLGAQSANGSETYPALVYFPSAVDAAGAAPLDLAAGQHQEVRFTLKMVPSYKLAGVITNVAEWKQVNSPMLVNESEQPIFWPDRFDAQSGAFEFRAIPAGSYWLQTGAVTREGQYSRRYRRLVLQSSITDLRVSVEPGIDIPIVLHTEFAKAAGPRGQCKFTSGGQVHESDCSDYPAARVELHSIDFPSIRLSSDAGPLKTTFGVRGVSPGTYTVHAMMNFGGYVQSVRCGSLDLLREPLVVPEGGNVDAIEVVLRDDPATLKIQVRTDKPSRQSLVLVFPDPVTVTEPQIRGTIQGGEFNVGALPPGAYKIFAFDAADEFDYSNLEALAKYGSQATSVKVGAGESASVVVDLIHTGE